MHVGNPAKSRKCRSWQDRQDGGRRPGVTSEGLFPRLTEDLLEGASEIPVEDGVNGRV